MHSYTKKDCKFEKVIFILAIISYVLAPYISTLFKWLITDEYVNLLLTNLGLSISSTSIFAILYFIFTKWIWKLPFVLKLLNITNFSGTWKCEGIGCKYNTDEKNKWTGSLKIVQYLTKMEIILTTDKSQSISKSVISNLEVDESGCCILSYMYFNKPNNIEKGLSEHEGFCTITFDLGKNIATGSYYTNPARKSYGSIKLEKIT